MGRTTKILILAACFCGLILPGFCFEEMQDFKSPDFDDIEVTKQLETLEIYFETALYEEAAGLLVELIVRFPQEPRFYYLQAIVDYQRGRYQQAQEIFRKFTEEYPDIPEPYYLLAEISLKRGESDQARQYLKQYCDLVPDDEAAKEKLQNLVFSPESETYILEDGKEDHQVVKKLGFYGACVSAAEKEALKLINGNSRTWSCMGIDFAYPLDLRDKKVVLYIKGKKGGERFELTFRDKFAKDYDPQMIVLYEQGLADDWQKVTLIPAEPGTTIDLSCVVHMGVEIGFSTVQNPAQSTLFVKDITIENAE